MIGQLRLRRLLHQPLSQLREHTTRTDDLGLGPATSEQLLNHRVGELLAELRRQLGRRAAGRLSTRRRGSLPSLPALSIRSISVLAFVDMKSF